MTSGANQEQATQRPSFDELWEKALAERDSRSDPQPEPVTTAVQPEEEMTAAVRTFGRPMSWRIPNYSKSWDGRSVRYVDTRLLDEEDGSLGLLHALASVFPQERVVSSRLKHIAESIFGMEAAPLESLPSFNIPYFEDPQTCTKKLGKLENGESVVRVPQKIKGLYIDVALEDEAEYRRLNPFEYRSVRMMAEFDHSVTVNDFIRRLIGDNSHARRMTQKRFRGYAQDGLFVMGDEMHGHSSYRVADKWREAVIAAPQSLVQK